MNNEMSTSGSASLLARLEDLDGFEIADGEPDVNGWAVRTSDGQKAGKIGGLIVDTSAMKVLYLDVELDKKALKLPEARHTLVPIGSAQIDENNDDVLLASLSASQLATLPAYDPHGKIVPGQAPPQRARDAEKFYGKRGGKGDVKRMTLSEEEMRIGKRQKEAGDFELKKTVETKHVSEKVPLMHEEVTVERRPVSPDSQDPDGISESEIRIPLMAEEAVVEKRTVANEEIVVRKKQVQGEQTVEADLRRERVDGRGQQKQPQK